MEKFLSSPIWVYVIAPGMMIALVAIVAVNIINRILTDRREAELARRRDIARRFLSLLRKSSGPLEVPAVFLGDLLPLRLEAEGLDAIDSGRLRQLLISAGLGDKLIKKLKESRGPWKLVEALDDLAWLAIPESEETVASYADSRDPRVAYAALDVLAHLNSESAYNRLLSALDIGWLAGSRVAAIAETARPIAARLIERSHSSNPVARYWSVYLMGRSRLEECKSRIVELTSDAEPMVRIVAAKALGWLQPSPDSIEALRKLTADPAWEVRAQAAKAVGNLGLTELAPRLIELLGDSQWWVREDAVEALEVVGKGEIDRLIEKLDSDDRFVRNRSAELLGRMSVVSETVKKLDRPAPESDVAEELLVKLGKAEALGVISSIMEKASEKIQLRLVDVLGGVGGAQAEQQLEFLAENIKNERVARACRQTLALFGRRDG